MLASWLTAWSFASLVSRFYAFLCGAVALTAMAVACGVANRPTGRCCGLGSLDIPSPAAISEVSAWITARRGRLTR